MEKIKHAFNLKGEVGKHIKKHGHRYGLGTFGTFALIKVFLIGASLLGFNPANFTHAAGGTVLNNSNVWSICNISGNTADCDNRGIIEIEPGTFANYSGINYLYLDSNQLTSLSSGVFNGLSNLQYLNLSNNQLASLPRGIFSGFNPIQGIDLRYNYFTQYYINSYGDTGSSYISWYPQNQVKYNTTFQIDMSSVDQSLINSVAIIGLSGQSYQLNNSGNSYWGTSLNLASGNYNYTFAYYDIYGSMIYDSTGQYYIYVNTGGKTYTHYFQVPVVVKYDIDLRVDMSDVDQDRIQDVYILWGKENREIKESNKLNKQSYPFRNIDLQLEEGQYQFKVAYKDVNDRVWNDRDRGYLNAYSNNIYEHQFDDSYYRRQGPLSAELLNEDFGLTPIYSGTTLMIEVEGKETRDDRTLYVGVPRGFDMSNYWELAGEQNPWNKYTKLQYGGPWDSCYRDWTEGTGPYVNHINNKIRNWLNSEGVIDCSAYPGKLCTFNVYDTGISLNHSQQIIESDGMTAMVWALVDALPVAHEKKGEQMAGMLEDAINSGMHPATILSQFCWDVFGSEYNGDINQCPIFTTLGIDLELNTVSDNSCGSEVYWNDKYGGDEMFFGSLPYSENTQIFTFWVESEIHAAGNGNDENLSDNFATIEVDVEPGQGQSCINKDRTIELKHGELMAGYVDFHYEENGKYGEEKCGDTLLFCVDGEFKILGVSNIDDIEVVVENVYNNESCRYIPTAENVTIGLNGTAGHTLNASYDFVYDINAGWDTTEIASSIDGKILHTDNGIFVIEGEGMAAYGYDPMASKPRHIYYYDKNENEYREIDSVDGGYFLDATITKNGLLYVKSNKATDSDLLKYSNGNGSVPIDPINEINMCDDSSSWCDYYFLFTPNENGVFYVTNNYLKYYNFDSGSSKLVDTLVNGDFNGFKVDNQNVFIPTKNGLFYIKEIGGENFLTYYNGTSSVVVDSIINGSIRNASPTENGMFYQIETDDYYSGINYFLKYSDGSSSRTIDYYNDSDYYSNGYRFQTTKNGLFYAVNNYAMNNYAMNTMKDKALKAPKYYDFNLGSSVNIESNSASINSDNFWISENGFLYDIDQNGNKTRYLNYYDFNSKKKVTIEYLPHGSFGEALLTENGVFYVVRERDEGYSQKSFDENGDDGDYSINKAAAQAVTYYLKYYDFVSKNIRVIDSVIDSNEKYNNTDLGSSSSSEIEIALGDENRLFYMVSVDGVSYIKYYNLNSDSIVVFDSKKVEENYSNKQQIEDNREASPLLTEDGLFYVIPEEDEMVETTNNDYSTNGSNSLIYSKIYHLKHFNGTTTNIISSSESQFSELFMLEDRLFSIIDSARESVVDKGYDDNGDITYENYSNNKLKSSINMHIENKAGELEGNSIYQWHKDGQKIPGANRLTYSVLPSDIGSKVSFSVIPASTDGMVGVETMSNTLTISSKTNESTGGGGGSSIANTNGEKHGSAESSIDQQVAKILASTSNKYTKELVESYLYAYSKGITTMPNIDKADMYGNLTRVAMAKMLSNYTLDLGLQTLDTSKDCSFPDVLGALDTQYDNGVTKACQLGLMGVGVENFNPYGLVTRAEFGTVLSRALYGDKYNNGKTYYESHLNALKAEGIMTKIENPKSEELRGRVMLMLMRSDN